MTSHLAGDGFAITDFWKSVHAVFSCGKRLGCEAFDRKLVYLTWVRSYIASRSNTMLFEDQELPGHLLAALFKGRHKTRPIYAILVAPMHDNIVKQFAIAHELGHMFLHGKLLNSGTFMTRPADPYRDSDPLRHAMEIEANVFALLCLVPTAIIDTLEEILDHEPHVVELQHAMSFLYSWKVDATLIQERLLIHYLLRANSIVIAHASSGTESRTDIAHAAVRLRLAFEEFRRERRSWSLDGIEVMKRQQERSSRPAPVLADDILSALVSSLTRQHILAPDHFVTQTRHVAF